MDPVEPIKALAAAKEAGCKIISVLTTHSHWDHDGGNEEMALLLKEAMIVGGKGDHVKGATKEVVEGDVLKVGDIPVKVREGGRKGKKDESV